MHLLRSSLVALAAASTTTACVPSRRSVFGPVERDVAQRVGVTPRWGDEQIPAAITALLAQPLDRDAAVRIALASNRRLQATYDELGIAAGDIASATVLAPTEVDLQSKGHDGGELEIEVIQDILDLLQLPQRRGAASAQLAAARARAIAATVMLVASVERAVVDVAAAQQDLELRQTAFDAASASADIVERMRAAGNAPELALVRGLDARVGRIVPGYMTMGDTGMGNMHAMELPENSISMVGGAGPFGSMDMGGMFTILKVRDKLPAGIDPGWYEHPAGTVSLEATAADLARDGITTT